MLLGSDVKRFKSKLTLLLVLCSLLVSLWRISIVKASGTIFIRADGSVEPPIAQIQRNGDLYTFNDDICGEIVVERSNIIIDGNGYTLQADGGGKGFSLYSINNVTIKNTNIKGFTYGVHLNSASNNTVSRNTIKNNFNGIKLQWSSNNTLSGNNIKNNNFQGIELSSSFSNALSENNITKNDVGIKLLYSFGNAISRNNITSHTYQGIQLHLSSNNILSENMMNSNKYNLDVWGHELRHFMHSIDVSNLVDGKSVYYLLNQKGLMINPATHPQVGYLALVNCTNVAVEGLNLANNGQGLLFAYTNNSGIADNNLTNNDFGVWLESSSDNNVSGNYIKNNDYGVWLGSSFNNTISGNNISGNRYGVWPYFSFNNFLSRNNIENNSYGVWFDSSFNNILSRSNVTTNDFGVWFCLSSNNSLLGNNIENNLYGIKLGLDPSFNNTFSANNIENNGVGVELISSSNNKFYHNNFINNTLQAHNYPSNCGSMWDDRVEGNYWSDYTGVDHNRDGISDTAYVVDVNNQDNSPLMGMFSSFKTSLGYAVNIISNSTIEDSQYFESNSTIKIHLSKMTTTQSCGFCRVCIPHALMNMCNISVIIDDGLTSVLYQNYTLHDNSTHRWIYFAYEHTIHEVDIIPDFSSFRILPVFMIATLLTVIIYRRKYSA